jgi:glycosyltransferase involved in cell wall biosynthesis
MPVVCSDVDGIREIAEGCEAAFLFPAGDSQALAGRLLEVAGRLRAGEDFTQAAVERASRYGLDGMVDEYVKLYRQVGAGA